MTWALQRYVFCLLFTLRVLTSKFSKFPDFGVLLILIDVPNQNEKHISRIYIMSALNRCQNHFLIVSTYEGKKLGNENCSSFSRSETDANCMPHNTFLQSWRFILLLKTKFPLSNENIKHTLVKLLL